MSALNTKRCNSCQTLYQSDGETVRLETILIGGGSPKRRLTVMPRSVLLLHVLFCSLSAAWAQDPVKVAPQNYKVLLENDRVRVLEALLKPSDRTPQHSHPARVVYSLSDHSAIFRSPEGRVTHSVSKAGDTVWRDPVIHSEENDGKADSHAILVEFKESPARAEALTRSDYFVTGESSSRLFVRHVTFGSNQQLPTLLVPGGSPPSEVLFDLPVAGYSLADDLARMGLDVFLMNPRGWGKSTPAPNSAEAVGDSKQVTADIGSVVGDILRNTGQGSAGSVRACIWWPVGGDVRDSTPRQRCCAGAIKQHVRCGCAVGITAKLRRSKSSWHVRCARRPVPAPQRRDCSTAGTDRSQFPTRTAGVIHEWRKPTSLSH